MSALIFLASIALTVFALACLTDWLLTVADPYQSVAIAADQAKHDDSGNHYKAARNPVRRQSQHPNTRLQQTNRYQAEIRELPFIC